MKILFKTGEIYGLDALIDFNLKELFPYSSSRDARAHAG